MPNSFEPGIAFAELTDIGMRRTNNQDSLVCVPARSDQQLESRGHLFVVADGMGAHAAGELASRMAIDQISQHYSRLVETMAIPVALKEAIRRANDDIHRRGQSNPEFHNMGTTASALVVSPQGASIGHVGDSRVYRLRDGRLEQWTFDHSLVWELEASGQLSRENASGIPKNVITRSLGPNAEVRVDVEGPMDVRIGDRFLLCSDGLTGQVTDEEIASLMECLDQSTASQVLIDLANLRGGPDNISVIVVEITRDLVVGFENKKVEPSGSVPPFIAITLALCFAAALFLGLLSMWIPMVVAIALGLVTGALGAILWMQPKRQAIDVDEESDGGEGPYRKYRPTNASKMVDSLSETIGSLRNAAGGNNWLLDWTEVDRLHESGRKCAKKSQWREAVVLHAEAITETMRQLREQHNRAAGETAIENH